MNSQDSEFGLTSICLAWAFTGIIHLLTFEWILPYSWDGIFYLFATLFLLIRPASSKRLIIFLFATATVLFRNYDVLANHLVLEFWIIVSLLVAGLAKTPQLLRHEISLHTLFQQLAPLVRVPYLLLFGFSFLSKLNADFLSPESSCASLFATRIIETFHLDTFSLGLLSSTSPLIGHAAIYLTLLFEVSIPCLLIFRSTRVAGIYLALAFHFLMGLIPILGISSFSSLSLALLLFFFPSPALLAINRRLRTSFQLLGKAMPYPTPLKSILIIALLLLITVQHRYFHPSVSFANTVWILVTLPQLWLMLASLAEAGTRNNATATSAPKSYFLPTPQTLALLNLPVLLLGALPYFALQTQGSFTMFSNLRILGDRPNHLFISTTPPGESPTLIKILSTSHPDLTSYPKNNILITDHELRRKIAYTQEDFHVLCEYDNEVALIGRFQGKLSPHPLLESPNPFAALFLRFRDVSTKERCECAW